MKQLYKISKPFPENIKMCKLIMDDVRADDKT